VIKKVRIYGYRWVVLAAFMLLNGVLQMHWINFAPITTEAIKFYHVPALKIGFLSMIFMVLFIFVSIPASYVIDTYGIRIGVGIGAVSAAVFGLLKGIYGDSYNAVLISSIGLAVGQPFVMNAVTRVAAEWFPIEERATASGLAALSDYIGFVAAMALTPVLIKTQGMKGMLMSYGMASLVISVLFFIFIKDRPPTPPTLRLEVRHSVFMGLKHMFRTKDMVLVLILFFIGLGIFNAVSTWIEQILAPRGISAEQAGLIGSSMVVGGIIGALILPILSDRQRKRKPYLVICMAGIIPGLIGMTFLSGFLPLLASSFVLGFFIMSAGPIGFQYGAEVSFPTPESTSQGMMIFAGQVSGIIFIFAMDKFKNPVTGSMTPFMIAFIVLMIVSAIAAAFLKESPMILSATELAEKSSQASH
jgi:MFS family permease